MSDRVVHFELPYDDGQRARSFYKEAFGWQLQDMPDGEYTLVMSGPSGDEGPTEPGFINGGLNVRSSHPAPGPVIVVDVPDIEGKLARIEAAGGAVVVGKQPVGDMGFVAYVRDPEGNVLGLWETARAG
ncbi:VOC family protein [Geodermatophilus sp. YIM 151500]|uniref:VOC family protein n=1 Tax=Geodermatophilus sp. YIM 151500 TaxID=2984531 RepID=UPI0021E45C78|nr:VOC family protein [Geodermatophilus sp. YIM 151500]MCV2490601.1 VOC family protein [Geodermatophilus sp. YIM 151500]